MRRAANPSRYCCARLASWKNTSEAPSPSMIMFSRPRSRSTITLSTTVWVKTGKSSCRKLITRASRTAGIRIERNWRRNGTSHARLGRPSGAFSNAIV